MGHLLCNYTAMYFWIGGTKQKSCTLLYLLLGSATRPMPFKFKVKLFFNFEILFANVFPHQNSFYRISILITRSVPSSSTTVRFWLHRCPTQQRTTSRSEGEVRHIMPLCSASRKQPSFWTTRSCSRTAAAKQLKPWQCFLLPQVPAQTHSYTWGGCSTFVSGSGEISSGSGETNRTP